MNWDVIEGNWKQFTGKVKEQWGKLTDDHVDTIAGKRDQLAGKIQETYGVTKDEAEKQIKRFEESTKSLACDAPSSGTSSMSEGEGRNARPLPARRAREGGVDDAQNPWLCCAPARRGLSALLLLGAAF
jgi:uncharacterized protein YjbJ (UPF0337 family)